MKRLLIVLGFCSTSLPAFATVSGFQLYAALFDKTGFVEVCGDSARSYQWAIQDRDETLLEISKRYNASFRCMNITIGRQFIDSNSIYQYISCAQMKWTTGCK